MISKYNNNYNEFILKTLDGNKVKVSQELCHLLEIKFKITNENARQIIRRAVKKEFICSSKPLTFSKGQFAYFLPSVILTKNEIKEISKSLRPALYRLLAAIDTNGGIISYYEALKITASPLKKINTKVDYLDNLIELLQNLDIVFQKIDKNSVKYIILKSKQEDDNLMNIHFAKMSLDTAFVKDILDWLINSNLIDNKNVVYRNKHNPSIGAKHNNLLWDAFGYTKTTGINWILAKDADVTEKQTLVVLDIVISRDYEQFDLDGFLSRIQINLNSIVTGRRKILPIIIYKNCSILVLNKIKKLGFLSYDIGSIYGANIYSVLDNISKLQINQRLIEDDSLEKIIEDTLSTISSSGQDDQLKAIKGVLFEVMIYQVLKHQYPNSEITPNYYFSKTMFDVTDKSEKTEGYEYDYIIKSSNPKEILVVEVKGYKINYEIPLGDYKSKNTTSWFFKNTLPFIKEKFKRDIQEGYQFRGCYVTSSKFAKEALKDLKLLNNGRLKSRKLDIYYDRSKLFDLLLENDFKNLKSIIDKFY